MECATGFVVKPAVNTFSMQTHYCKNAHEWQAWLKQNHDQKTNIWLVFYKKTSGKPTISYADALDEALCFGWIDSLIKKIDEDKYARKFTPRRPDSKWSDINKKKVAKLIAANRMTRWGLVKIKAAKENGMWDKPDRPAIDFDIPEELQAALNKSPAAKNFFETLAPSLKKQYVAWIVTAKRPETKASRIEKSIEMLKQNKKLGLV